MLEAFLWGLAAASSLVVGAVVGLTIRTSELVRGFIMAFGSGVLISALAYELTEESFRLGGALATCAGLAAGALSFFVGDLLIAGRGGRVRKRSNGRQAEESPRSIALGAGLDGIPESVVIGLSVLEGAGLGVAVVAAVFLSNLPEALSATVGFRKCGYSARTILGLWAAVAVASGLASLAGFTLLDGASDFPASFILAYAAGAVLTMLADTMMPEAFEYGGRLVGLATVLGFGAAFALSQL
ncbi:MAG: ZIP family zinc transporter [Streptosporangiales bacterium]|nr:ZIP family zinc transporter [Streptosporangiales bacterium]